MREHINASSSGSRDTQPQTRKPPISCAHHWILENTKYPVYKEKLGQVNLGRTRGHCKKCGKTRRWESPTPDNIHGIESLIISNIKLDAETLPEGFQLEEDLLEEDYDA